MTTTRKLTIPGDEWEQVGEVARQMARNKTHCPQGHPYSGANLYVNPRGFRQCKKCRNDCEARRRYARRRQLDARQDA